MAPRLNSPQKTKIVKKSKFASKLIDNFISNIIESKVKAATQNPKTVVLLEISSLDIFVNRLKILLKLMPSFIEFYSWKNGCAK